MPHCYQNCRYVDNLLIHLNFSYGLVQQLSQRLVSYQKLELPTAHDLDTFPSTVYSSPYHILVADIDTNHFNAKMCHRQLLFQQSAGCGHLTKVGEINVDCRYPKCFISSIHSRFCGQNAPCSCRRYYSNPVRKITAIVSHIPPWFFWALNHFSRSQGDVLVAWSASSCFYYTLTSRPF